MQDVDFLLDGGNALIDQLVGTAAGVEKLEDRVNPGKIEAPENGGNQGTDDRDDQRASPVGEAALGEKVDCVLQNAGGRRGIGALATMNSRNLGLFFHNGRLPNKGGEVDKGIYEMLV